ncbi:hypothetical protein ACS0TY_016996 [Phlomoides rotata]
MLLKGMEFDTAHFITDVSGKYPRLWALKGAHPVTVNRWYKFGVLASIRTVAPGFREISELPDWVVSNKNRSLHKEMGALTDTSFKNHAEEKAVGGPVRRNKAHTESALFGTMRKN